MAVRTVSNAGGNWNSTAAWTTGVVPIAGDVVNFTATSGNLTVNVLTPVLGGIDFSNYVGTITFDNGITSNGPINLGTGGYTQAGGSGLFIGNSGTATLSGTAVWSRILQFQGTNVTTTLANDITVTGTVSMNATTSHVINGNILNIQGNLSVVSTATISGTTSFVLNGTGTWNHTAAGAIRNNVTINTAGTLTIGTNIYYNTGTLTYTAGTVTTTSSTLNISASTTLNTNGITWNNATITATSTLTLSSNLAWSGTFSITSGNTTFAGVGVMSGAALSITTSGTVTLNNDITCTGLVTLGTAGTGCTLSSSGGTRTIITSGGITNSTTTSFITFNINIRITGGVITSSGSLSGGYYTFNTGYQFEIDGNVTFSASTFYIYGGVSTGTGGTFKYTSGTVTTTGSTIWIQAVFFNSATINWNNVWFISGSASTTVLQSDVTVNGLLTLGYLTAAYTINNDGTTRTIIANSGITMSGSTSVVLGTANIRATSGTITGVSSVQLRNNLEIAGNVTFANGVTFNYNTGTLLYTSGTVTTTNSTLNINASTTLNTSGITWNNVTISITANTTITLSSNFDISGTTTLTHPGSSNITLSFSGVGLLNPSGALTINNNSNSNFSFTITIPNSLTITNLTLATGFVNNVHSIVLNSNSINVTGNLTVSGTVNFTVLGTTNLNLTGTGTWSHTGASQLRNNLTINSPSGTVTISGNVYYNTGILTYTAGTVTTAGSTLNIGASSTLNTSGMTWNNVTLSGTQTLTSGLNVGGNLTTQTTAVVLSGVVNVNVSGNLTINITTSGTATIILNGTGTWSATSYLSNNLTINTAGTITIGVNVFYNTGTLLYTAGTVNTTTNNSTLNINTSATLNTNGITWNNVAILLQSSVNITITLPSDFNITGTTTFTHSSAGNLTLSFSGVGTLNSSGALTINNNSNSNFSFTITVPVSLTITNLTLATGIVGNVHSIVLNTNSINITGSLTISGTVNFTVLGTTNLNLTGTGTWSHTGASQLRNNLTINSLSGTITIGANVYYNTGTLTYTAGTVDATTNNSTLNISTSTTLNVSGTTLRNITYSGTTATITLSSNLLFNGTFTIVGSGTTTVTLGGVGIINSVSGTLQLTVSGGNLTITTSATHNILNYYFNAGGFAINGSGAWNVYGDLIRNGAGNGRSATGTINFIGTGSILFNGGATGAFVGVWNINPSGTLTFGSVAFPTVYYEQSTINYIGGTVNATNCTLYIGSTITSVTTTLNTNGILWKNITINGPNTISLSSNFTWDGVFSCIAGVITISGAGTLISSSGLGSVSITGSAGVTIPNALSITTLTITSSGTNVLKGDITCSGLVSLGANGVTTTINNDGVTRTIIATSGITVLGTTSAIGGSANMRITGGTITASGSLNGAYIFPATFEIAGNITFASGSTLYFYGGGSGTGIFTYTSGTVTTTNSTIWFNSCSVNSAGITWNNVWILSGNTNPLTLTSNMLVNGLLTLGYTTINNIINNNGTTKTITAAGGITMSGTTSIVSGTANIIATGGTITGVSSVQLRNNLEIAGNVTFANGVTFNYNTGTLLYTSGIVTTTNSTLSIAASTTLNTDGINWNNLTTSGTALTITITLSSNLTVNNTLTFAHTGTLTFTLGIYTLNFANNLVATSGTTTLPTNFNVVNATLINSTANAVLNGFAINISGNLTTTDIGICSGTTNLVLNGTGTWSNSSTGQIRNNLTIDTSGTITVSGTVYYNIGTLTYTTGEVNTSSSTLVIGASTTLNTRNLIWNNITFTAGTQTLTSDLNIGGNLTTQSSGSTINGLFNVNINRNIIINITTSGTATMRFVGTGSWSGISYLSNNIIVDTDGSLDWGNNALYQTGSITYVKGRFTKNYWYIYQNMTLLNFDKVASLANITISSGVTVTMNEFFSGRPDYEIRVSPSLSSSNYTIAFQGVSEKIAKFVNISGATISRRNQLLVITAGIKSSTNVGVRYINNLSNEVSKGDPSVQGTLNPGIGSLLVGDPVFNRKSINLPEVTNDLQLCLDTSNPVSYPGSGAVWTDLSEFKNNASLISTSYQTVNNPVGYLSFNGSSSYGITSIASQVINNFTMEIWCRPTNTIPVYPQTTSGNNLLSFNANRPVISAEFRAGTSSGAGIQVGTNGIAVNEHSNNFWTTPVSHYVTISNTLFTNITVVYISKQPSLYINGVFIKTGLTTTSSSTFLSLGTQNIGQLYGFYQGDISIIKCYNRSLTASEILQNYNATRSKFGI